MSSAGQTIFSVAYEDSPIIFQDGIAQFIGGYLPVTLITEVFDVPGLLGGQLFAKYKPMPGGTLADWQIAEYPFASLQVAANAVIQQPLKISMMMICPAQNHGGYIFKQAILTALKIAVESHILSGGSFTVITPAFTYTNCLLTGLRDITPPSDKQVQYLFQWDFVQPLITASGAQQVLSNLMNKFEGGLPASFNLNSPWGQPTSTDVPVYNSLAPGESIVP
jgi:hypothetical protein